MNIACTRQTTDILHNLQAHYSIRLNLVNFIEVESNLSRWVLYPFRHELLLLITTSGLPEPNRTVGIKVAVSFFDAAGETETRKSRSDIKNLFMANYYCEYCGHKASSVSLTAEIACVIRME